MDALVDFIASAGGFVVGTLLPFFFILIVVVFVHELGHYLVGRWCGIGVKAFAIGFGPELFGYTDRRGTRWKFCAVPLGGYVKFVGDVGATSAPDGEELLSLPEHERAVAFQAQALWKKSATVVAGPIANFILAIVILTGFYGWAGKNEIAPVVGSIIAGSPAAMAGVMPGDRFVEIEGRAIRSFPDMQHIVTARAGDELDFVIERDGARLEVAMTPQLQEREDGLGNMVKMGLIGVAADQSAENFRRVALSPLEAVNEGWVETVRTIERTLVFLKRFVGGREDRCQLGGPVKIAEMAGQAAGLGMSWLITLTAFLSIGIGIMNLLPVPPLDGGHLLLYGVEAVARRPLPAQFQEWLYKAGFLAVMALIAFVLWNDLVAC
jgi:regulator of sigma E protease